jgi:dolichol kinase
VACGLSLQTHDAELDVRIGMTSLLFSDLTTLDIYLIIIVDSAGFISLAISCLLANRGYKRWIPRKFTHIAISSLIALVLPFYSNLTGPTITIVVFVAGILGASVFGVNLAKVSLSAGTREEGSRLQTFLAAFFALVAYLVVFLVFIDYPMIFVASILAVSWGDGAGEVVGRPFGRHKFHIWRRRIKSVEGSLAVVLMTFLGILSAFLLHPLPVPLLSLLITGIIVSLAVAATEVACVSWMDNVAIPLLSAFFIWFLVSPFL